MKKPLALIVCVAAPLLLFLLFSTSKETRVEEPVSEVVEIEGERASIPQTSPPQGDGTSVVLSPQNSTGTTSVSVEAEKKTEAQGYFLLPNKNSTLSELKDLLVEVDGMVIISTWKEIEPEKGVYDFSSIDQKLKLVEDAGKHAALYVFTGKNALPSWISNEGVATWRDSKGNELIYPTDETFATLWKARVAVLGARYDKKDAIRVVTMCGPAGTLCGPRYPELPEGVAFDDLKQIWLDILTAYETSFPNTLKHLEIHLTIGHGTDLPSYLIGKSGDNVGLFAEFLSDVSPVASMPVPQVMKAFPERWCGFQMVSPLKDKVTAAIEHGSSFGCTYFEIYQGDISNGYF